MQRSLLVSLILCLVIFGKIGTSQGFRIEYDYNDLPDYYDMGDDDDDDDSIPYGRRIAQNIVDPMDDDYYTEDYSDFFFGGFLSNVWVNDVLGGIVDCIASFGGIFNPLSGENESKPNNTHVSGNTSTTVAPRKNNSTPSHATINPASSNTTLKPIIAVTTVSPRNGTNATI